MLGLDAIAERRIQEAVDAGDLDALPGSGRALRLDDDALVPVALRVAHRILRNAHLVPVAMSLRRELRELEQHIANAHHCPRPSADLARLALLRLRLDLEAGAGRSAPRAGSGVA